MARELSKNQVKYFEDYIQRAGEKITRFVEDEYPTKTIDVDGGWFEYSFEKDSEDGQKVFFIHTAYSNMEHKDTKKIWNKIKAYAKENGCKRIVFETVRDPKLFKRLFNAYVAISHMKVDLTEE